MTNTAKIVITATDGHVVFVEVKCGTLTQHARFGWGCGLFKHTLSAAMEKYVNTHVMRMLDANETEYEFNVEAV